MILTGEIEVLGEKPVSVPLCASQIPHVLAWDIESGLRGERSASKGLSRGVSITSCSERGGFSSRLGDQLSALISFVHFLNLSTQL
jgi:hypothetical protein